MSSACSDGGPGDAVSSIQQSRMIAGMSLGQLDFQSFPGQFDFE